jgi:4-amino-4-deoxy-L-arabinose transferase-like glycosyltransferase
MPDTAETAIRTPGYVLMLAALFRVFGENLTAAQTLNALLSMATAVCVFQLCRKWGASSRIAALSGLVFYFHPATMSADSRGAVESTYALSIILAVLATYKAIETGKIRHYFLTGIAFGWAWLVRSTAILFPVFLFWYLLRMQDIRSMIRNTSIFLCGCLIVLSPWIVRNYMVFGEFIPTMTVKGIVLFQAQYVVKNGGIFYTKSEKILLREAAQLQEDVLVSLGYAHNIKSGTYFPAFYNPKDEVRFSRYLEQHVIQEYRQHPFLFAKACVANFFGFWFKSGSGLATVLNAVLTVPLLFAVLLGLRTAYRERLDIAPVLLFIVSYIVIHIPILGRARYCMPILPLLLCLAAIPFIKLHQQIRSS